MQISIREDDPCSPTVRRLLEAHLATMNSHSPPESVHALDVSSLRGPDVTFWTAWDEADLLGCGALKEIDPGHGEVKSMHTAETHRGKGVAAQILVHILDVARARGYRRLSLETGSMAAFASARGLYARHGFEFCAPFAGYREDPNSVFMTLELTAAP